MRRSAEKVSLFALVIGLLVSLLVTIGTLRLRFAVPVLFILTALQAYFSTVSRSAKITFGLGLAFLLAITFIAEFPSVIGDRNYSLTLYILYIFTGASFSLVISNLAQREDSKTGLYRIPDLAWLVVPFFILFSLLRSLIKGEFSAIVDETVYLLQAHSFDYPGFVMPVVLELLPSVLIRQLVTTPFGITGQYPAGWPFLIWLSQKLGSQSCLMPLLASLGVVWTAKLTALFSDKRAGIAAALLLASSSYFLVYTTGFYSHIPAATFLIAAAYFLTLALRGRYLFGYSFISGVCFAVAFSIRPLTSIGIAFSIFLWAIFFLEFERKVFVRVLLNIVSGALPVLALLLFYNFTVMGNPLLFGYTFLHGNLHNFGFGQRGMVAFLGDGSQTAILNQFTFLGAGQGFFRRFRDLLLTFGCLSIPVLILLLTRPFDIRQTAKGILPFLVIPFLYLFYPFSSSRFLIELLPFIAVGISLVLSRIFTSRSLVVATLILLSLQILNAASQLISYRDNFQSHYKSEFEQLITESSAGEKLLVFVKENGSVHPQLEALSWFNRNGLDGNVVVLRKTENYAEIAKKYFPNHRVKFLNDPYTSSELPLIE